MVGDRDEETESLIRVSARNALRRARVPLVLETDLVVHCSPSETKIQVSGATAMWAQRHIVGREIHSNEARFELTVVDRDATDALRKFYERLGLARPLLSGSSGIEHLFGRRRS